MERFRLEQREMSPLAQQKFAAHLARKWAELGGYLAAKYLSGPARPYWLGLKSSFLVLQHKHNNVLFH